MHFPVLLCTTQLAQTKFAQSTFQYYFVLDSLHKVLPSTFLYYKASTKDVPVLLCTTKLEQNTFQHYFVLQSLHKDLPSTSLHYKACTKYFPVLLCITKLAHMHFPVLLCTTKLDKALPSTTLYYKAWQSTSQYYVVLQSLHKALPSTTLYYKACTKHVPVLSTTASRRQRKKYDFEAFLKEFYKEHIRRQNCENLLTNNYRSLGAATPIRLKMSSCKQQ